jgi:mono/diheme cytochrome c family protein
MRSRLGTSTLLLAALVLGCDSGDWLGPMERGFRAAFNGWDMWTTEAVRPYEDPMPERVEGTRPVTDEFSLQAGRAALEPLSPADRKKKSALTYRRYCHHCHGPNGDGRIIVGESHEMKPTDLRSQRVQTKSDEALFQHLQTGGELMLPLAATMSPLEMLLAIEYLRTLKGRPSEPYFKPKFTAPIR